MEPESWEEIIQDMVREHEQMRVAHEHIRQSPEYIAEQKYIRRLTWDFIKGVHLCLLMGARASQICGEMLLVRMAGDIAQSAVAALSLAGEGLLNPIKREIRYVVECAVKSLFVDQVKVESALTERLDFLQHGVPSSSIEVADQLVFPAFDCAKAKEFTSELKDVYYKQCGYVHPSRQQIEEWLEFMGRGQACGCETQEELRQVGRLLFRAYDMVLVLFFHGLGLGLSGDIFTALLDGDQGWKFHKGKYVKLVSAHFDYKAERQKLDTV